MPEDRIPIAELGLHQRTAVDVRDSSYYLYVLRVPGGLIYEYYEYRTQFQEQKDHVELTATVFVPFTPK